MSKIDTNVLKDGQLAVATAEQNGTIISDASAVDATALVQTDNGPQLCVKTFEVGEGGGGGGTVDQTYDATSTNAQSGTAVAEAVAPALKNTATGTNSLTILGTATSAQTALNIGYNSRATGQGCVAIKGIAGAGNNAVAINGSAGGYHSIGINGSASDYKGIAIGGSATKSNSIQFGNGTNSTENTLQVFAFQLLDGTTGLIPADRLGTGYDATKTQVLKNVNGTLTWVDE